MAISANPNAKDAPSAYTVLRAFYWAGEVASAGTVLQLAPLEAAALKAANKVAPTEPTEPVAPTEPVEPVAPTEPVEPVAPTEPVEPVAPTEPVEPVAPTEPVEPVKAAPAAKNANKTKEAP